MNIEADAFADKTKKQREQILLFMKNKAESMFNRPSPAQSIPQKPIPTSLPSGHSTLQFLKQYESNKTSQPDQSVSSFDRGEKSFDYNSTLFRNLKQQSHIAERPSDFFTVNNGSAASFTSAIAQNYMDSNELLKGDGLLSKIDELLEGRNRKKNAGKGIGGVYDEYLDKKSMSNSSAFSNTSSIKEHESSIEGKFKSNTNTNSLLNKLKTIQQQEKAILTIDRDQIDQKQKNRSKKSSSQLSKPASGPQMKRPPLAPPHLQSVNAIERQKKKIQQTMLEIKKEQINQSIIEKQSLIFEFSDNDSEGEDRERIEREQQKEKEKEKEKERLKQKQKQKQKWEQKRRSQLMAQRSKLVLELQEVQCQLETLQRQQQQEQQQY